MSVESVLSAVHGIMERGDSEAPRTAEHTWQEYLQKKPVGHDRCIALAGLAESLHTQGKHGEAEDAFRAALNHAMTPMDRLTVLVGYAKLVCDLSRSSIAQWLVDNLCSALDSNPSEVAAGAPWGYAWLTYLQLLLRDNQGAMESANRAVAAAGALDPVAGLAEANRALADARKASGDVAGAMASLEEAMVAMRQRHCLMEARAEYADLALLVGDVKAAESSLMRAIDLPDLRDRRVIAKVLRSIRAMYKADPDAADHLMSVWASRLEGTHSSH